MTTRKWVFGSLIALAVLGSARADMIGPARPRYDVVNTKLFTSKDLSDYVLYTCRTGADPEKLTLSADDPTTLTGGVGVTLWIAAIPKDKLDKLGEEKLMKALAGKKYLEGVMYSTTIYGYQTSRFPIPPGPQTVTNNYEITVDKKISLHTLTDAQAKKFGKGSGSGSASKSIIWFSSPDGDTGGDAPFWAWEKLQVILAGLLFSIAVAISGVLVMRRRVHNAPIPVPVLE